MRVQWSWRNALLSRSHHRISKSVDHRCLLTAKRLHHTAKPPPTRLVEDVSVNAWTAQDRMAHSSTEQPGASQRPAYKQNNRGELASQAKMQLESYSMVQQCGVVIQSSDKGG